jgi:AcrR family transcriptional regulator
VAEWATRTARDRAGSETRALLVEKAAAVFAERGYANTTIADITLAAGVSRATCYVYFASKDEVFQAVAERLRDLLLEAHELPDVDADDLHEVARRATVAFFEIYAAHATVLRVIEHQALVDPVIAEIWTETRERPLRRTVRFVQRIRAAGHRRTAGSPRAIAEATIAVIADFAHRHATGTSARENRRTAQDAIAICLALLGLGDGAGDD